MNEYIFSRQPNDEVAFWVIVLCPLFYIIYWFVFGSEQLKQYLLTKYHEERASKLHHFCTKTFGFVLMGIAPTAVFGLLFKQYTLSDYGIRLTGVKWLLTLQWILFAAAIILPFNWFAARRLKTMQRYPLVRVKKWNTTLIVQYALAWILYLLGYEALFRGFFFFPVVNTIGVLPAIAVNMAVYTTVHIPKGVDETFGALILGFFLCMATLETGAIWAAFTIHVVMALSNSITALFFNPEMQVTKG